MADDRHDARPGARLGAFDIGCVVVGGIIGVGIFFTPGRVAARVDGPAQVIAAWSLGGVIAMFGGLVFAELSRLAPGYGGTFVYIGRAFGRLPAFLYGWSNWLAIQAGALGVIGLVMAEYLDQLLFGSARSGAHAKVAIAVGAILAFTALNYFGLRVGKRVQNSLTVLKTLAVFTIVVLAVLVTSPSAPPAAAVAREPRGWLPALASALLPVMFSFGGWQQGSFVAGAARRPARDVPLGILGGVAVVILAYLTVNLAFLDLLGFERAAASGTIAQDALLAALGESGHSAVAARLFAGMVVISSLGIMNTICLAPPWVLHEMSRQGLFPRALGALHPRHGSPARAVLVQGCWGALLLLVVHGLAVASARPTIDTLDFLCDGVVFIDWLFFSLCGFAALRIRARAPPSARWRLGGPVAIVFALLGSALTAGAIATKPWPSLAGLALSGLGILAYRGLEQGDAGKQGPGL